MTARELISFQLDDAGYQLDQVLSGFPEDHLDQKAGDRMSPREMVAHLCETYVAVISDLKGQSHEWGSFKVADCSTAAILSEFRKLRQEAVQGVLDKGDEAYMKAHAFIVGHDYYHVGQLAGARVACDPGWDSYSIYR